MATDLHLIFFLLKILEQVQFLFNLFVFDFTFLTLFVVPIWTATMKN